MIIFSHLFTYLQWIFIIYLGFSSLYIFVFAFSALFYKDKKHELNEKLRKFLILIPAYKEDVVIKDVAKDATLQNYPSDLFDVYIIADTLKAKTVKDLKNIPVNVLEVSFEQSTKAKSINKALEMIKHDYEGIIILDADNLMEPDFINKINDEMNKESIAIQGHRIAKNKNSSLAVLDGVSEEINNSIFRKGHVTLGLSSALIGSGMAFDFQLYKSIMSEIDSFAEDKEMEFKLFKNKHRISFLSNAYVFDEKVSKAEVFVGQRSRWIAFQLIYAKKFFFPALYQLFANANVDYFDKVFQQLLPPRILLLGLTTIFATISTVFNQGSLWFAWLIVFALCVLGILIAIPKKLYTFKTLKAVIKLPLGFMLMILSLFKIKKARRGFNPTQHFVSSNEENSK